MKTKILMAAITAGMVMMAADSQAAGRGDRGGERPDFATLDLNGDGLLTREELQAQGAARFAAMDTDGDGMLSTAEIAAHMATSNEDRAARMVERMDENDDGMLSAEELQPCGGDDRAERMFDHADADEDGAISQDEFDAVKDRGHRGGGRGHGEGKGRKGDRG